jgi:hypothetical protein
MGQPRGHSVAGRIMSMKNFNDTIGNRTCDLPTCSAVPQPTLCRTDFPIEFILQARGNADRYWQYLYSCHYTCQLQEENRKCFFSFFLPSFIYLFNICIKTCLWRTSPLGNGIRLIEVPLPTKAGKERLDERSSFFPKDHMCRVAQVSVCHTNI